MNLLFAVHVGATLVMVGVIWVVQVVHYPLFALVGEGGFAAYQQSHAGLIGLVVVPMMLVEAGTAVLFLFQRPSYMSVGQVVVGLVLVGLVWGVTFFVSVPQHGVLSRGFEAEAHRLLVMTNWWRTLLWSLRGGLVLWVLVRALPTG